MQNKVLVFMNYYGKTSETFISDEINFLNNQKSIKLSVLHYGTSIGDKNVFGLSMPSSFVKRGFNLLQNFNLSIIKSFKYKNGLNGTLAYLISYFKQNQFDTIYCHFGNNGKLIAQLKALNVIPPETKIVIRFHGLDMNFTKYPIGYYNILNRYCDIILTGSEFAKNNLRKYDLNKNKINLLPVGVKVNDIQNVSAREGKSTKNFNILSIGRLINLKGYLDAIDIMQKLKSEGTVNFSYTIIGDGPLFLEIQNKINHNGLGDFIKIIKKLPHSEVLGLIQISDIYLYSGIIDEEGRAETQGLANLEAMSKGLVIVASNIGGVADYVINSQTGFLCESANVNEFAAQIKNVIQNYNSENIQKIRRNAIKIVQDNYCQEHLNNRLLEILLT